MNAFVIWTDFSFVYLATLICWISAHRHNLQERKLTFSGDRPDCDCYTGVFDPSCRIRAHRHNLQERKITFSGHRPNCDCYTGVFDPSCRLRESVEVDPIILTDPSWDDYQSTDSFEYMEKLICEEMWNIFGAKRARCKLLDSRSNYSTSSIQLVRNKTEKQIERLDDLITREETPREQKTPVESTKCDCQCKFYEQCVSKGVSYRCECKLYHYKELCVTGSNCDNKKCYLNSTCADEVEDCYACGCQLFQLGSQCELHTGSLLVITFIFIAPFIVCIAVLCLRKRPHSILYIRVR